MKWLLHIVVPLAASFSGQATQLGEIEWQDQALAGCVLAMAQKRQWQAAADVDNIKCHSKGIKSTVDLVHFANIRQLSLFNNQIQQADLRHLANLEMLNLAKNQLRKLEIAGLANLQSLFLFRNNLSSVDLGGLVKLQKLRMMQNQLKQLDITPLQSLATAHLFDNQLEDLQITGLRNLTFLDVRQNPMPDELYDFYDEQEGIVISHDGNADDWK